mmetsp:Transcript_12095/g.32708  ORF Transcript_12095/g.32708 Transcript_12095/m.32708 type:complete len:708 (+) Transcript_12095:141-2264(+)
MDESCDQDWIAQKLASSIVRHGSLDVIDGSGSGLEQDRDASDGGPHDHLALQEDDGEDGGGDDGSFSRAAMKKRAVLAAASQPPPKAKPNKTMPRVPLPSLAGGTGIAAKKSKAKKPPKKESPALPSVLTAADLPSMKSYQIKAQLKARGLSTGGLRPYLVATLEKVLAEEACADGAILQVGADGVASAQAAADATNVGSMGERAEAVRSKPVKVTSNQLTICLLDFAYDPAHVKIPFGATVTFVVEAAELGMVEYQVLVVCKNDEMTLPATRSPPLQRSEKFVHQFVEVGQYEVSDPNYADMRGTVEVYPTPGWEGQKLKLLKAAQARREAASEAERLEEERQRANERHKFIEDERKWRVDADADAARQRDEESSNPALARAREEARAAAIAESAAAVSGGWRSKASGRAKAWEERQRARQIDLEVRLAKEAESRRVEEEAAAVRRIAEQAEAAARWAAEEDERRIREEDERGRLEYERIMRGEDAGREGAQVQAQAEAESEQAARGSGGSTPRLPSLQPRRPSNGQAAKSASSPRKTPHAGILKTQENCSIGDGDGAVADAPVVGLPVDVADAAPGVDLMRVLIEDCEATPRAFEICAGAALSFVVGEEEPEHFEYGFEVRRLSAGANTAAAAAAAVENAVENAEGEGAEGEGELLSKSETITAGETWVCTFDEPGVYVVTDPDFSPECDVRVLVLQVASPPPRG